MIFIQISSANFKNNITDVYPEINLATLEFKEATLEPQWFKQTALNHQYHVLVCTEYEGSYKKLCCFVKPLKPYYKNEFETIFGFKANCSDYDPERIVAIEYINKHGIKIYE